jgi:hypothetical protein
VVLPALSFSREADTRSIYVIATKPVPRWAISGGKLLGVGWGLAAALAVMGAGAACAARLALHAEARRAEDPEVVRLNLEFRREQFPAPWPPAPSGNEKPRPIRLGRGQSKSYILSVPEKESGRQWLVVRLHARPANPLLNVARVGFTCGGGRREVFAQRDRPVDVPVECSAVDARGNLVVSLAPAPDPQGNLQPVVLDARGGVALAVSGNGLELTLAKSLLLLWFQLMVVAAVTLAAAGALSFPVAAVAGASTAIFGQLSGLAVGLLHESVRVGAEGSAGSPLGQFLRKLASGELELLPDFEKSSAADFLARGDFVPWSFLAGGVLFLLGLRVLPVALGGALAFARREVGR